MNFKQDFAPKVSTNTVIEDMINNIPSDCEPSLNEEESLLIQAFQTYASNGDFNLLMKFLIDTGHSISLEQIFPELTDGGYYILLNHNFFSVFCNFFSQMKTSDEKVAAMKILLSFSVHSPEVSEQILGSVHQTLISYLTKDYLPLHDLCIQFCENLAQFPTIAKQLVYDEQLISNLSSIYLFSPSLDRKDRILNFFSRLTEFDKYNYHKFVELVLNEQYLDDILPRNSAIHLLWNLSYRKHTDFDPKFQSEVFIQHLKLSLNTAIQARNEDYVITCLKFINIHCQQAVEAKLYYDNEFVQIFSQLPDQFIIYFSPILISVLERVEESNSNAEMIIYLIQKVNNIIESGNYNEKSAAVSVISMMTYKNPTLFENEIVLHIITETFDMVFANPQNENLKRILNLWIAVCDYEIIHQTPNIIVQIHEKEIIDQIIELIDDPQIDKLVELLKSKLMILES